METELHNATDYVMVSSKKEHLYAFAIHSEYHLDEVLLRAVLDRAVHDEYAAIVKP